MSDLALPEIISARQRLPLECFRRIGTVLVKDEVCKSRIKGIGFVRCVCAIIIICFHYSCNSTNQYRLFYKTANSGWGELAVTVFFLVSGACLYANYPDLTTKGSLKKYFFKRWKAIFPMFYISYVFFYLSNVIHTGTFFYYNNVNPWSLILTVLGLDGYFLYRIPNYYILGEWFLGAILLLYCLYPLILRSMRIKIVMPIILLVGYYLVLETDIFVILPFRNLICCMASFYIGMVMMKHQRVFFENRLIAYVSIILFLLLAMIRLPFALKEFNLIFVQFHGILLFISLLQIGRIIDRFRVSRIIEWIGKLSYPIFLLHHEIVLRMLGITDPHGLLGAGGMYLLCIVITIACAYILSLINKLLIKSPAFNKLENRIAGIKPDSP